ncbi:MFS transporter [Haemophilus haemolyticus]|uniref:MFS transporter n=1 Tax=Haemophilus haemolyticus TaxID=726 RepID=UPI0011274751|nr:MFS transporter [Haemophilus haemolyticus]TPH08913.1 MFS transporter [Haemophilus haemolyticus]
MQHFGNANKATSLTKQDWAILATTAGFKFCVVAFYMIALITMLKEMGFDLKQLSWFYLLGGMEMAKFIVSPLIERYRLKRIGQFRGWLCLSSLIIFIALFMLHLIQPQQDFALLMVACVLLNLSSLFFGCAALGLTCAILPFEQRGFGGIIQVIAGRVGKMLGGGLVLLIYHHYGWQSAVDLISVFALLLILQSSLYSEPRVAAEPQNPPLRFLFTRFFYFWQQPHISFRWLILLLFVFIPSGMVVSSFVPRLNTLGWSSQHIGLLLSVFEPLCAIAFAPLSGLLLKKYSRVSVTQWVLFSQIFAFCLFILFEYVGTDFPYLIAVPILLLSMTYALLVPCLLAMIMDKSTKTYATLDSALQFSIALLGAYLAGFISIRIAGTFGYLVVYIIATFVAAGIECFFICSKEK